MICLWILLNAATNLAQDVSDVDVLTSLPSQSLECSLKFDRDFIASNEELALALETLMEEHAHDESAGDRRHDSSSDEETPEDSIADNEETPVLRRQLGRSGHRHRRERNGTAIDLTRRPRDNSASDSSDDSSEASATRPPRGDGRHDSSDSSEEDDAADVETTEAAVETEETPLLRRLLERKNRHHRRERNATRDNSASDSSSRDSSEEYADIETPEAGATRPPRGDRRHDSSDSSSDSSEDVVVAETTEVDVETTETAVETEETPLLRRVLKRRRGDNSASDSSSRDSSEEHADVGTPEAGATRPPRGDRRHDSSDSSSDSSEDVVAVETTDVDVETTEAGVETEETPLLRRVLGRKDRRSRDNSASDSSSQDSSEEHADVGTLEAGATRRPREDSSSSSDSSEDVVAAETTEVDVETTETPLLRRALRPGKDHGRRRSRGVSATISNGSVQVAGLTGEVVFGDVDAELQTIPLAITFGETSFSCDVALRHGNKVFCRASSAEDEFHLRVGCEIPADEE